jgi:hypothetical protein
VQTNYRDTKRTLGDGITLLESTVERTVAPSLDLTAIITNHVMEAVLPEPTTEDHFGDSPIADVLPEGFSPEGLDRPVEPVPQGPTQTYTPELSEAIAKCSVTASKAKRRAYVHALQQISSAQTRTTDSFEKLRVHAVDLISYAQSMVTVEAEMVDVHREIAVEAADAVTTATVDYVEQQRELIALFMENPVGTARATVLRTVAKVG